jgi:hypothetical protein
LIIRNKAARREIAMHSWRGSREVRKAEDEWREKNGTPWLYRKVKKKQLRIKSLETLPNLTELCGMIC